MKHGKTELLYLDDSYLKDCESVVVKVLDQGVVLDRTCFHPCGGGLVSDIGLLSHGGYYAKVLETVFVEDGVLHVLDGVKPSEGSKVYCMLDWERRYRIMRMHTGLHVLAATMVEKTGALITGNNITPESGRVDFSLESFDRALMEECVEEANRRLAASHPVRIYYMEREKVLSTPGLVKLANRLPPETDVLRIVEIGEVDVQADGGPHVKTTSEVGRVVLTKMENKGRSNRRLYFGVTP